MDFYHIYGCGGHLGYVTRTFKQTIGPLSYGVSIRNLSLIDPLVSEDNKFENVEGRTDDVGWTPGAGVICKLLSHL